MLGNQSLLVIGLLSNKTLLHSVQFHPHKHATANYWIHHSVLGVLFSKYSLIEWWGSLLNHKNQKMYLCGKFYGSKIYFPNLKIPKTNIRNCLKKTKCKIEFGGACAGQKDKTYALSKTLKITLISTFETNMGTFSWVLMDWLYRIFGDRVRKTTLQTSMFTLTMSITG